MTQLEQKWMDGSLAFLRQRKELGDFAKAIGLTMGSAAIGEGRKSLHVTLKNTDDDLLLEYWPTSGRWISVAWERSGFCDDGEAAIEMAAALRDGRA